MDQDKTKDQKQESEEAEDSAAIAATEDDDQTVDETTDESDDDSEDESSDESDDDVTDSDESTGDESEEEDPKKYSKRENKAIERLRARLAEANKQAPPESKQSGELFGSKEYTPEEANKIAEEHAARKYSEGLAQAQAATMFHTRLEIDMPKVASKYPILDNNSEQFDPGRAALINEMYLRQVGFDPQTGGVSNPNIRYEEFADGIMNLVDIASTADNAESSKRIAKARAKQGVRPGGAVKKTYSGSDPKKMSDEQLSQQINSMLGINPR